MAWRFSRRYTVSTILVRSMLPDCNLVDLFASVGTMLLDRWEDNEPACAYRVSFMPRIIILAPEDDVPGQIIGCTAYRMLLIISYFSCAAVLQTVRTFHLPARFPRFANGEGYIFSSSSFISRDDRAISASSITTWSRRD